MQTVVCMKWGTRYGPEFVNRLYAAVQRNTARPTRLVCLTDDADGLDAAIETAPIPEVTLPPHLANLPWRKLALWKYPLHDLEGDVLFLDLDLVVTGDLDAMFDYEPGRYCVIENWTQPGEGIGNTSAFRFPAGKYAHIYNDFQDDPQAVYGKYRIEQLYISREIDDQIFWPSLWCVSFKHQLLPRWPMNFFRVPKLPPETKVVAFTGKPDQDEALRGEWPEKNPLKWTYKHVRPTPWIADHW